MTEEQEALREAMEWLERAENIDVSSSGDDRHRATLKRRLAMPVMPEEPTPEMLASMRGPLNGAGCYSAAQGAWESYRALYAHLTKPRTKTVWRVSWGDGHSYEDFPSYADTITWLMVHPQAVATTIAPVEVPA